LYFLFLQAALFRNGWDDSVKCMKKLKGTLSKHFSFLQQHLCSGGGGGGGNTSGVIATAASSSSSAAGGGSAVAGGGGSSSSDGGGGGGGLEAVQQLLVYICECVVSLYVELLLTNTSIVMNLNTISRLSEDLELLTKLFEELRNKIYLSRHSLGRAPHVIESVLEEAAPNKRRLLTFGVKPKLSVRRSALERTAEPGKYKRLNSVQSSNSLLEDAVGAGAGAGDGRATFGNAADAYSVSASAGGMYPGNSKSNSNPHLSTEEETKATFKALLQPLAHLVLAVQMNNQYLPDFVKQELYQDFGISSVNIWQLIMYWRKETKEDIESAYEKLFARWVPEEPVDNPTVDVTTYIVKVKPAFLVGGGGSSKR
jgi:hypothetical protein